MFSEEMDTKTCSEPTMSPKLSLFISILMFLSPNRLFKYFKRRYSRDQTACLNGILKVRGRLKNVVLNVVYLRQCLLFGVAPKGIQARVKKAKVHHSLKIEKAFLKDEIERCEQSMTCLRGDFLQRLRVAQEFLSYHDYIRFARMLSNCDVKQRTRRIKRNQNNLSVLKQRRFGSFSVSTETIVNLSGVELTDVQKSILCRGMHFGVPRNVKSEEILCEFELFYCNLAEFVPHSKNAVAQCRSSLEALAYGYAEKRNGLKAFSLDREHMKVLRELRRNEDLVITRPDKGRATVLLTRTDYVAKMTTILGDATKFLKLGPVDTHDKTPKVEATLNEFLAELRDAKQITDELFQSVRSTGAIRPRMYGLPKIHKEGNPLRPILSMTGSPQYNLSKWLCHFLEPVVSLYNSRCVKDSFEFIDRLKETQICKTGHMCSFDVVSLFTNVPLEETINICADAIYRNEDVDPILMTLDENSFRKMLRLVTLGVEFSFDNVMYRQVDGVAMGSPLGPVLANIFVGYCEARVPVAAWPALYCRFVDDSFAYFDEKEESDRLLHILNGLHPALKFTCEHEEDSRLPYMDVQVEKVDDGGAVTSVYRKPTFTGLYITWDSFCATKHKVNVVRSLVRRAQRICSAVKLQEELAMLMNIFSKNGYPVDLLKRLFTRTCEKEKESEILYGPRRCPLYLRLPWKGNWSSSFAKNIASVTRSAYYAVDVHIAFSTARAFNLKKDVLPSHDKSKLVYEFECRNCSSRYVGRTLQRLNARIRQHAPLHLLTLEARLQRPARGRPRKTPRPSADKESIRPPSERRRVGPPRKCKNSTEIGDKSDQLGATQPTRESNTSYQSSVAIHLAENPECAKAYDDSCFHVLSFARSVRSFEVLETLLIKSKCLTYVSKITHY